MLGTLLQSWVLYEIGWDRKWLSQGHGVSPFFYPSPELKFEGWVWENYLKQSESLLESAHF
jgi:hypothetical protein